MPIVVTNEGVSSTTPMPEIHGSVSSAMPNPKKVTPNESFVPGAKKVASLVLLQPEANEVSSPVQLQPEPIEAASPTKFQLFAFNGVPRTLSSGSTEDVFQSPSSHSSALSLLCYNVHFCICSFFCLQNHVACFSFYVSLPHLIIGHLSCVYYSRLFPTDCSIYIFI